MNLQQFFQQHQQHPIHHFNCIGHGSHHGHSQLFVGGELGLLITAGALLLIYSMGRCRLDKSCEPPKLNLYPLLVIPVYMTWSTNWLKKLV